MKKTIGILIIICLSILSFSKSTSYPDKKNDVSKYGLKGNVKSVKSELFNLILEKDTFRIGEKENGIGVDRNLLLEFNQHGNLTSSMKFLANGKISNETDYTYDEKERLVNLREIDNYGKGSFLEYKYNYNSLDSIIELIISENNFKQIYKIERDENNRPIKGKVIQNDTIFMTYIMKYDQNGNMIVQNEFRKNDIPKKLIERTFNKENLKEKENVVEYNTWDTLTYENRFFYDKNQKLILEKLNIVSDSTFNSIKNTYHQNGQLKELVNTIKDRGYFLLDTQKYNENGDLIEHAVKTSDSLTNDIWRYLLKYDSENNWIEEIEYKNNKPLRILKRTIEYYK